MTWLRVSTKDFNMDIPEGYGRMVKGMLGPSTLTLLQRHMIAVVVSSVNECRF